MTQHLPEVERITARQEKFWLEMGFQKFEKGIPDDIDLSNFFFWSGNFDLSVPKKSDLGHLEKPGDSEFPDASMDLPKEKPIEQWFRTVERGRPRDNSPPPPEEPPEKRVKLEDDPDIASGDDVDIGLSQPP